MKNSSTLSFSTVIIRIMSALLLFGLLSGCVSSYTPPLQATPHPENTAISPSGNTEDVTNVSFKQDDKDENESQTTSTHTAVSDPAIPLSVEMKQIPGLYKTNSDILLLSWEQLVTSKYINQWGWNVYANPQ